MSRTRYDEELDEKLSSILTEYVTDKQGWIVSIEQIKEAFKPFIADRERQAVYNMHKDIIGTGNLELGQETDQAFNYARIHRWIDSYIERLTSVAELSTEGDK